MKNETMNPSHCFYFLLFQHSVHDEVGPTFDVRKKKKNLINHLSILKDHFVMVLFRKVFSVCITVFLLINLIKFAHLYICIYFYTLA